MSLGSIIGGVVGGVVGFFVGGPVGAAVGFGIGFGVGSILDPTTPDAPTAGSPNPEENVMLSSIGDPCKDLCGTGKVAGHLLAFGGERSETNYAEAVSAGGKGGAPEPQPQSTGQSYYMSWAVGLLACKENPVDVLYAIYKNDDAEPVWPLFDTEAEALLWEGIPCPASGGMETIVVRDIGSVEFYFGTNDHALNSKVGALLEDPSLNVPYRNFCWAFFDDCYIGKTNRTPTYKFVFKKIPQIVGLRQDMAEIDGWDANPSHVEYYIMNALSELPSTWLNDDAFAAMAETLYREERGISILFDKQNSAMSYLESVNNHVNGIIRYGSDAQFHPKLIRDDYQVDDLLEINETNILEPPSFQRGSWMDTINEVKVQYNELYNIVRANPALETDMPAGHIVALLSKRTTTEIYGYVQETGAIVKINVKPLIAPMTYSDPFATDYLVVNDDPSYFTLDIEGTLGSRRGAYAISKDLDGNRIWYCFRNNASGDIKIVQVDISEYPMKVVASTIYTAVMAVNEKFEDAAAVNDYAFFPTSSVSGRILKFDEFNGITDKNFNYPTSGTAEAIHSITINPFQAQIAWLYNAPDNYVKAPYAAYNFSVAWTYSERDTGLDAAAWQNFLRYDEIHDHIFRQRVYWPANGVAYYYSNWEMNMARNWVQGLQYMKAYLGGNIGYFYVIHKDNSGGAYKLHRFNAENPSYSAALTEIDINVNAWIYDYGEDCNSVYNDIANRCLLLRYNASEGVNYIASFNSSLTNLADTTLDTIYWGQ